MNRMIVSFPDGATPFALPRASLFHGPVAGIA
jgi:hypothetical protein